jgi:hypothetical protein
MKQPIEEEWKARLVSQHITGIERARAEIDFKIQPNGQVTDIAITSSEGGPSFPLVCVSSINDAQPFDPVPYQEVTGLPAELINKPLNIHFTFSYKNGKP